MCYHYSTYLTAKQILERFAAKKKNKQQGSLFEPVHHVTGFAFPQMPVVTAPTGVPELHQYYWGLIPRWVSNEDFAKKIRAQTLNARSETILEKPSFRSAVQTNRCLVPATGFYEWHTTTDKRKIPHYIYLKDAQPFAFAGIYDEWLNRATGELVRTYSIATTEANPLMAHIHNSKKRMPVVLPPQHERAWIDPNLPATEAVKLLQPLLEDAMQTHTISKLITTRGENTNVPEVHKRHTWPGYHLPGEGQQTLF